MDNLERIEMIEKIKESLFFQVSMCLDSFEKSDISGGPLFFSPDNFYIVLSQKEFDFLVEVENAKKTNKR